MVNLIYGTVTQITEHGKATCELFIGPLKIYTDIPVKHFPESPYYGMPISLEIDEEKFNKVRIKMRPVKEENYWVRAAKIQRLIEQLGDKNGE